MTKSIFADSTKFGDSFFSGKNLSCAKMTKSVFADLTKFGDSFFSDKTCLLQRYAVAGSGTLTLTLNTLTLSLTLTLNTLTLTLYLSRGTVELCPCEVQLPPTDSELGRTKKLVFSFLLELNF